MPVTKTILLLAAFCGLVSFKNPVYDYGFTISMHRTGRTPKDIRIHIVNHSKTVLQLSNLVFCFYVDDEVFKATWEKARFLKKDLVLTRNQDFNATVRFDSLTIYDYRGRDFSILALKNKMQRSKKVVTKAAVSDWRRLENPLESSTLTWSNPIEF